LQLVSLREAIVGDVRLPLLVLQVAVALVLLIACANVSSLLIARATGRRRELAVRASLGAQPGHLVRQLLTESLVLGAAGGALGLLIGAWLIRVLVKMIPPGLPRVDDIGLDWRVTAVTLAVSLLTGILFGLLPALQAGRTDAAAAMKESGERESSGRSRGRSTLVVLEVAMTLVLLVGAGLLASSFLKLSRVDSGFKPEHVVVASLYIPQSRYPTAASQIDLENRLVDRLSQRGAWQSVGIGFPGPLRGSNAGGNINIQNWPDTTSAPFANLGTVSGGYFAAMGQTLLEGRTFTDADRADGEGVVVVSATLAHRYWPGESAIGKHVKFDDDAKTPWSTIVGIVSDARQLGLGADAPPIAYLPYAQFPLPFTTVAVRSTMPLSAVSAALRSDMNAIDPDLPLSDMQALQTVLTASVAEPRFRALMIAVFAGLALLLAAVGLSGLVSYSVAQRTREFGIRVALGAQPRQVLVPLLREGATLAIVGIGVGLIGAFALTRVLRDLLFGVTATDPITFIGVSLLLFVVTILATYLPARRAMRVNPLVALRQ
jgi:putative ABC transport system permease protein